MLVSYDPFSRLEEMRLHSLEEQFLQVAPRYERERGSHPYADAASDAGAGDTPLDHEYLKLLQERHQEQLKKEAQRGIDYHAAQRGWSLAKFLDKFAKLLGRKGGASGLSTHELELLGQVHRNHPRITAPLLEQAFQRAEHKTIPVIVFHLQNLLS